MPVRLPIRTAEPPANPALVLGRLRLDAFVFVVTAAAPLTGLWYVTGNAAPRPAAHPVLLAGICTGCLMVGLAARDWGRWVLLVRLWLPVRGLLPWRLGRFAEDARQRGIFRRVGAVYQFREVRLQHRLAADHLPSAPWHRLRSTRRAVGLTLAWGVGAVLLVIAVGAGISALAHVALPLEASDLNTTIRTVINLFSTLTGIVAIVMIIYGGFKYVTSGGDSGNISSAKNTIIYAVISLTVVAFAQAITQFVLQAAIT